MNGETVVGILEIAQDLKRLLVKHEIDDHDGRLCDGRQKSVIIMAKTLGMEQDDWTEIFAELITDGVIVTSEDLIAGFDGNDMLELSKVLFKHLEIDNSTPTEALAKLIRAGLMLVEMADTIRSFVTAKIMAAEIK